MARRLAELEDQLAVAPPTDLLQPPPELTASDTQPLLSWLQSERDRLVAMLLSGAPVEDYLDHWQKWTGLAIEVLSSGIIDDQQASFADVHIEQEIIDFALHLEKLEFPGDLIFSGVWFKKGLQLRNLVVAGNLRFLPSKLGGEDGEETSDGCRFSTSTLIESVSIKRKLELNECRFTCPVRFTRLNTPNVIYGRFEIENCYFSREVTLSDLSCYQLASIIDSRFYGSTDTILVDSVFRGSFYFQNCHVRGARTNSIGLRIVNTQFKGFASFEASRFGGKSLEDEGYVANLVFEQASFLNGLDLTAIEVHGDVIARAIDNSHNSIVVAGELLLDSCNLNGNVHFEKANLAQSPSSHSCLALHGVQLKGDFALVNSSVRGSISISKISFRGRVRLTQNRLAPAGTHLDAGAREALCAIDQCEFHRRLDLSQNLMMTVKSRKVELEISACQFYSGSTVVLDQIHTEARVEISNCRFEGSFSCRQSIIEGGLQVNRKCSFDRDASFDQSRFAGEVVFREAVFSGDVCFLNAEFKNDLRFLGSRCQEGANFAGARFGSHTASDAPETSASHTAFDGSSFEERFVLDDASFIGDVSFRSVKCSRGIGLKGVVFQGDAPDFEDCDLETSPQLDFKIQEPQRRFQHLKGAARRNARSELASRFRILRMHAAKGFDNDKERHFLREEMKHTPVGNFSDRIIRILYGALSNYGLSAKRPIFLLALLTFAVFPALNLIYNVPIRDFPNLLNSGCLETSQQGSALSSTYLLSLSNTMFIAPTSDTQIDSAHACLKLPAATVWGPMLLKLQDVLQSIFSVMLAFLIGFAVRNSLRIR